MTEPLYEVRALRNPKPVGYYCDHSDEPYDARTHHAWEFDDDGTIVFRHLPNTISAHAVLQDYVKSEQRCPRAVPVYAEDVPALMAELEDCRTAVLREARNAVVEWLVKKANEHRARGSQYAKQADVIGVLADKVNRGAIKVFPYDAAERSESR